MERLLRKYDREYMKMAMLKHEETFREQVNELHRLYRVQKLMMRDMRGSEIERRRQKPAHMHGENNTAPRQSRYGYRDQGRGQMTLDLELPAEEYTEDMEQESDIELTLAIGGSSRRKKEDVSLTSDSATSFSSSSTTDSGGENLKVQDWGLSMSYPGERSVFQATEGPMRHDDRLKQPSWRMQYLSLNMT